MKSTDIDIMNFVKKFGADGAICRLSSDDFSISDLRQIAFRYNILLDKKLKKVAIAIEIINSKHKMIDKSHDDLLAMNQADLFRYLSSRKPSRKEIVQLLSDFGITPSSKDKEHSLVDFASRELSSLGVYKRVSSGHRG